MSSQTSERGAYQRRIENRARNGYPNLSYLVDFMNERGLSRRARLPCSCTVLTFEEDLTHPRRVEEFIEPPPLPPHGGGAMLPRRVIYILEDLSNEWIEYLGFNLDIDPAFFLSQIGSRSADSDEAKPVTVMLPSVRKALSFTTLVYFDAICLKGHLRRGRTVVPFTNVERTLRIRGTTFDSDSAPVTVGLVDRRISFWQRTSEDGGIKAVILVDSPLPQRLALQYRSRQDLETYDRLGWKEYGGGYLNFSPQYRRPNRQSFRKDLEVRIELMRVGPGPFSLLREISSLQQRIVLSRWMVTLTVLQREFNSLNLDQLDDENNTAQETGKVLNDLMSAQNLLISCCNRVRRSLDEVGVVPEFYAIPRLPDEDGLGNNWRFLMRELSRFRLDTEDLIKSYMRNLQIHDSKRVDYVNKLAGTFVLIYTPLGAAYGILSMGGDFAPGQKSFWVFFIVALPLIAATVLVLYAWQWSLQLAKLKKPKKRPQRRLPGRDEEKGSVDEYTVDEGYERPRYERSSYAMPPTPPANVQQSRVLRRSGNY